MLRPFCAILFLVGATAAGASQELPGAQEYPVVFETKPLAASARGARGKVRTAKAPTGRATQSRRSSVQPAPQLEALVAHHASANGVPSALAHRVIMRESRYNPSARNRAYWGLMQISHATARGIGYRGPAQGLLDPNTNLRYGMAYLGNAYRVAGGDESRAVRLYSSGYYYEAKRKGMLGQLRQAGDASQLATR
ncbi:MAG: lytic transglycosylase domain-containing protein [Beijerinckiaceae bacterium]|nr:lytic transglycosylase domain-containing protein [Beijerinckiaceae bacterium]